MVSDHLISELSKYVSRGGWTKATLVWNYVGTEWGNQQGNFCKYLWRKGGVKSKIVSEVRSVNFRHLRYPEVDQSQLIQKFAKGLTWGTLNTRSVKNKIRLINDYNHSSKVNKVKENRNLAQKER